MNILWNEYGLKLFGEKKVSNKSEYVTSTVGSHKVKTEMNTFSDKDYNDIVARGVELVKEVQNSNDFEYVTTTVGSHKVKTAKEELFDKIIFDVEFGKIPESQYYNLDKTFNHWLGTMSIKQRFNLLFGKGL